MIIDTDITSQKCSELISPIGDALYVIGGKWKLKVIAALHDGNKRFNEVQRVVSGISSRVLSSELKELELNGFVKRDVHIGSPVTVEYGLTPYASTLGGVLQTLADWGLMHREKLKKER